MYTTSYHTHTTWSDGAASIERMIESARQNELDEIGFSDHYVLSPDGAQTNWAMEAGRLGDYVKAVQRAMHPDAKPLVRLGLEVDFFPLTVDRLKQELAQYPFDYIIGSVHFVEDFAIDESHRLWEALSPEQTNEKWRLYWQRVREMAESGVADFAAHLDLPKKFGHRPTADLTADAMRALDAIAAAGMAIEINTAGYSLPAHEAYPSLELLMEAHRRGIALLINSDAHTPANLARNYERARELAKAAGYTELARYEGRERYPVPL